MHAFFSEVVNEINAPKLNYQNLSPSAINQIKRSGSEVKLYLMKNTNIGAARVNPILKLFQFQKLTREEYVAACRYQRAHEIAQISHHARPSYDGTSISSIS